MFEETDDSILSQFAHDIYMKTKQGLEEGENINLLSVFLKIIAEIKEYTRIKISYIHDNTTTHPKIDVVLEKYDDAHKDYNISNYIKFINVVYYMHYIHMSLK
jgi:hypothetical protein